MFAFQRFRLFSYAILFFYNYWNFWRQFIRCLKKYLLFVSETDNQKYKLLYSFITNLVILYNNFLFNQLELKKEIFKTSMNFNNLKQPKLFKTLINGHLMILHYLYDKIQFQFFDQNHQDNLKKAQFLSIQLFKYSQQQNVQQHLSQLFQDIKFDPLKYLMLQKSKIVLKIGTDKLKKPFSVDLILIQTQISQKQSIFYLKQHYKSKQKANKSQILKLKGKIYVLMTQVEDASVLIKSQSSQVKLCRQQVKSLKNELKILEEYKKKQEETSFIEVGIQHDISSIMNDKIECLENPDIKQFYLDREKVKELTMILQKHIFQNQKRMMGSEKIPSQESRKQLHRTVSQYINLKEGWEGKPQQNSKVVLSPKSPCLIEKSDFMIKPEEYNFKPLELS